MLSGITAIVFSLPHIIFLSVNLIPLYQYFFNISGRYFEFSISEKLICGGFISISYLYFVDILFNHHAIKASGHLFCVSSSNSFTIFPTISFSACVYSRGSFVASSIFHDTLNSFTIHFLPVC